MKKLQSILKIAIIIFLLIIYVYVVYLQSIPENIIIFEGENIKLKTMLGLKADLTEKNKIVETISNNKSSIIKESGNRTFYKRVWK